jgi:hypothetical protein
MPRSTQSFDSHAVTLNIAAGAKNKASYVHLLMVVLLAVLAFKI